jgi:glucokinase
VKKSSIPIGRPSVLRHTNARGILKLLRESGSCSRADLVRASGLSAPTVTNVVKDLLSAGLVEPLGEGRSSGGRPPDMLRFKAERGCLMGVEITAQDISFLLTDLNGVELDRMDVSLSRRKTTPEAICSLIGEELKVLLRKQKKSRDRLLALVAGVPAITNVEDGSVLSISTLEAWRSVPLRAMLGKVAGCLVIVENDTNLAAHGEHFRGFAQGVEDFVFINIGNSMGAGILLGGRIHHGAEWSAGEIGYLRLPSTSRRQLTIHEFGELETMLTGPGILTNWGKARGRPLHGADNQTVGALDILNLAQAGDARAVKIARQRSEIVADIVVNLSLILNPGLIVLGGDIGSHPALIDFVQKQLEGGEFAVPKIASSPVDRRATLWGAISLALEALPSVLLPHPAF